MSITLTATAAKEIKKIIVDQELGENAFLRVGLAGGGCSGYKFLLDLTVESNDNDEHFEQEGIDVICDPKSLLYLAGTTIDFKDEIMGKGFIFDAPLSTSKCGCGSSASF